VRLDHLLSKETESLHYEFYGELAQLGEHLPCKQGVKGSIPLFSTTSKERFERGTLETQANFNYFPQCEGSAEKI
jgi:hypothetical protein